MKTFLNFCILYLPLALWSQDQVLEAYIQEGLAQNLGLARENTVWKEQQLKVEEARGNYFPTVSFNAAYLRALGGRTFEFPVGTLFNPVYTSLNEISGSPSFPTDLEDQEFQLTPNDFLDARLFITQPIYNPQIYYGYKAQQELLSVQEAQIQTVQDNLRKDISVSYYNFAKTRALLAIYDSTEVQLRELLRFNTALVKHDKATEDIIATVEYELERLQSDRVETLKDQAVAQAYFNTLLHRSLDTPIEVSVSSSQVRSQDPALTPLLSQALENRSEPLQVQRAIQANQVLTQLEQKRMHPTIGLELSGGFQAEGITLESENFLGTGAISMNWTLFEGQKRRKRIAQTQNRTQQLKQELEILQEQIQLQVIQAWNQKRAAIAKWEADRAALRAAGKSFSLIEKRYKNQQALLVEYLDARTRWVQARIAVAISDYDVLIRQAELDRTAAL